MPYVSPPPPPRDLLGKCQDFLLGALSLSSRVCVRVHPSCLASWSTLPATPLGAGLCGLPWDFFSQGQDRVPARFPVCVLGLAWLRAAVCLDPPDSRMVGQPLGFVSHASQVCPREFPWGQAEVASGQKQLLPYLRRGQKSREPAFVQPR